MHFITIPEAQKLDFSDLLLLADEQMDMVERYLHRGTMFALCDPNVKSICVVTKEGEGVFEIKNLATRPEEQRKGYGRSLVHYVVHYCKNLKGSTLLVGTGETPSTLGFYEKCGFVRSHRVKNFFVENYDHVIIEDGKQLVDMVYLQMAL